MRLYINKTHHWYYKKSQIAPIVNFTFNCLLKFNLNMTLAFSWSTFSPPTFDLTTLSTFLVVSESQTYHTPTLNHPANRQLNKFNSEGKWRKKGNSRKPVLSFSRPVYNGERLFNIAQVVPLLLTCGLNNWRLPAKHVHHLNWLATIYRLPCTFFQTCYQPKMRSGYWGGWHGRAVVWKTYI